MPPESCDCPSPVYPRPGDSLEAPAAAGQGVGTPTVAARRNSALPPAASLLLMEFQA
jgi:hypothetical protein